MAQPARPGDRGQVLVIVVVALVVLFAMVGLANDIGYAWRARVKMQAVADAAAMAGADALFLAGGVSPSSAARSTATQNGFTNGSGTSINPNAVAVTVNNPPSSGPNSGNSSAVEVIVAQAQPTYFLAVAGFSSLNVSARAVAAVNSSGNCMYSLNPSASGALNMASNSTINSSCGLLVNSNSSTAVTGASGSVITAPSLGIVGGSSFSKGTLPGTTTTGVAAFSDPLAYIPTPSPSGSCSTLSSVGPSATVGIPAGYYCGLTVKSNSTVNLTSTGTYSFNGNVTLDSNTTLNGTGVTLYFKSGSISLSSNTILNLSAPASGTYSGILFFQDRSDSTPLSLSSNSAMTLTGVVYAPAANLTLASNAMADVYSILVASTINIAANSTINCTPTTPVCRAARRLRRPSRSSDAARPRCASATLLPWQARAKPGRAGLGASGPYTPAPGGAGLHADVQHVNGRDGCGPRRRAMGSAKPRGGRQHAWDGTGRMQQHDGYILYSRHQHDSVELLPMRRFVGNDFLHEPWKLHQRAQLRNGNRNRDLQHCHGVSRTAQFGAAQRHRDDAGAVEAHPAVVVTRTTTRGQNRAQAMVEFALVVLITLTLVFLIIQSALPLYAYSFVSYGARSGARYAMVHGSSSSSPATSASVQSYVQGLSYPLDTGSLTVTTTWNPNKSPGSTVTVVVSYVFRPLGPFLGSSNITMSSTAQALISN